MISLMYNNIFYNPLNPSDKAELQDKKISFFSLFLSNAVCDKLHLSVP